MKLNNGAASTAMEDMAVLCGPNNRLPVVASLDADRGLRALVAEFKIFEPRRVQYIEDHGTKEGEGWKIEPGSDGWDGYVELMEAESGVDIKPLRMADIQAGYSRDPETGEKGLLDISPAQLGALVELGLIVETVDG